MSVVHGYKVYCRINILNTYTISVIHNKGPLQYRNSVQTSGQIFLGRRMWPYIVFHTSLFISWFNTTCTIPVCQTMAMITVRSDVQVSETCVTEGDWFINDTHDTQQKKYSTSQKSKPNSQANTENKTYFLYYMYLSSLDWSF